MSSAKRLLTTFHQSRRALSYSSQSLSAAQPTSPPSAKEVTAVSRKKVNFAKPYESPEQILENAMLKTIIQQHSNSDIHHHSAALDRPLKIAVLAHLSRTYQEPVPSNVLSRLDTLGDIAQWYSQLLKPVGALPHTRRLLHATLDSSDELDDRIDLEREQVHDEFLSRLPPNLTLHEKTFRKADPAGMKKKWMPPKLRNLKRLRSRPSPP